MESRFTQAYGTSQKLGLHGRQLEANAFLHAARSLNTTSPAARVKGLRFTHMLWTTLQADLSSKSNKLPEGLKADLLSLSLFVDTEISRALKNPMKTKLTGLIEINRNLAAGLMTLN